MRCAICQRENADDARFCNGCGRSLVPVGTSPSGREPRAYTPHHLAQRILRSRSALYGERKQVTVLFADVKDSVALSQKVDAETWHEILDRLFEIVMRAVHRFEGTINQFTGDGVMALFGAPLAHEDHAQRACGAALRIKRDLQGFADALKRSHGLDFAVRMGLNSGEVIVGAIGDDLRMDYTATGRTVGLAARLEGLAASGEAYLGESTASLASGYFELEPAGSFQVKGLEDSIEAFRLVGAGPLHTRLEASAVRGLSRLVGRVDEMARLLTALEEAFSGEGRVLGVRGDEGVGKSRLCMEFGERCASSGIPVHRARGISHASQIPLFPILELIRGEFGINERDSDPITSKFTRRPNRSQRR